MAVNSIKFLGIVRTLAKRTESDGTHRFASWERFSIYFKSVLQLCKSKYLHISQIYNTI